MSLKATSLAATISGTALVFRRRLRERPRNWDVAAFCSLIAGIVALSWAIRYLLFGNAAGHTGDFGSEMRQWLSPLAIAATIVLICGAAVSGASAAPTGESDEDIESSLVAGLSPLALCTGRLLAALRVLIGTIMTSFIMWCAAQTAFAVIKLDAGGIGAIFQSHFILLAAVIMIGAISFAVELGRTNRSRGRGIAVGLIITAVLTLALLLINPVILTMQDPVWLVNTVVLVNPVASVEGALGSDVLHARWVYAHTSAADYLSSYPSPLISAGVFFVAGVVAHAISIIRLRRAYK